MREMKAFSAKGTEGCGHFLSPPKQRMVAESSPETGLILRVFRVIRLVLKSRFVMRYFALLMLVFAQSVRADLLTLRNASFEEPALAREGTNATASADGWIIDGTAGVFVNNGAFGNRMEGAVGEQLGFLNGTKAGSLQQIVAEKLDTLTVYSAKALVGLRKDTPLVKGASLLIKLQAVDADGKVLRTLGVKEILVGREPLSDERLTEFVASYTAGVSAPKGRLRVLVAVGDAKGEKGDWTIDSVRVEASPAPGDLAARLTLAADPRARQKGASGGKKVR